MINILILILGMIAIWHKSETKKCEKCCNVESEKLRVFGKLERNHRRGNFCRSAALYIKFVHDIKCAKIS